MWSCEECDNGDACERCDILGEPVLCDYCYWQYWLKKRDDEREWHIIVDLVDATWNKDYGSCDITKE